MYFCIIYALSLFSRKIFLCPFLLTRLLHPILISCKQIPIYVVSWQIFFSQSLVWNWDRFYHKAIWIGIEFSKSLINVCQTYTNVKSCNYNSSASNHITEQTKEDKDTWRSYHHFSWAQVNIGKEFKIGYVICHPPAVIPSVSTDIPNAY